MANRRRNALVVPGVDQYLNQFKLEIAKELGIQDYDNIDKGALPARVHGMIGGTMTKRLIEMGQQALAGKDMTQSNLNPQEYVQQMQQEITHEAPEAYAAATTVPIPSEVAAQEQQGTFH